MTSRGSDTGDRPIRVLIVDDQRIMLTALRAYVESAADMIVVGEAMDGRAALLQVGALAPDVVVMDLQMPGVDGIEATALIRSAHPGVAVLAVTTFQTEEYALAALRAGAGGYLVKSEEPEVILNGIRALVRGESVLSADITRLLIDVVGREPARVADPQITARAQTMTTRERDVLAALCRGQNNREIARTLHLSETTVKTHISSIMTKLDVRDRVQIVVTALTHGLVERD